ncbi:MAG TPA: SIS domain-containing protein [Mycobacteriales bacterium]|nr:SIS domain-containing protein [Mycobacteriales bacterium]
MTEPDLDRLDDVAGLTAADPQDMLRAVATSAAQIRASLTATREAALAPLGLDERPRAIVVAGMGGSAVSGDVLAAVVGLGCPVPVVVHRGPGLPGWVGAADLVVAVSCSGGTAETLAAAGEAVRRHARLLGVGSGDSPLEALCSSGGGSYVPVTKQLSPRSTMWGLVVPLLVVAERFGLADLGVAHAHLEAAAVQLESLATLCGPDRESFLNPAKALAAELSGALPMVWGSGQMGPVAAARAVNQIAENAKLPAIAGALPEAAHNQVVAFDGPLAAGDPDDDLFRDRVDEAAPYRVRLVLVRDDAGEPAATRLADVCAELAGRRGVAVSEISAQGAGAIERFASLVGLLDYASVYLALAYGIDPTPIAPIDELKLAMRDSPTL